MIVNREHHHVFDLHPVKWFATVNKSHKNNT